MLPRFSSKYDRTEFLKEIDFMKSLEYHIHLVNMVACRTIKDPVCLVMEFCSSGDLLKFVRSKRDLMKRRGQVEVMYNSCL